MHVYMYHVTSPDVDGCLQELIRRWDSERELFYNDIMHVQASAYAHWIDFLIYTMLGLIYADNQSSTYAYQTKLSVCFAHIVAE